MTFLQAVAANSDCNRMDEQNLAVCLAPNLLTAGVGSRDARALQAQTAVVAALLAHAGRIGNVEPSLVERTRLMAVCYPSEEEEPPEDEEEGGEGHNESSRARQLKKKKKKRRSGSLQGRVSYF